MLLKDKSIAIIGAGPGGLTLAKLLQQKGIDVKVYERDKDKTARQQGATLDLHQESGLKALQEAGLMDEFKKHYRPGADRIRITDGDMVIYLEDRPDGTNAGFGDPHFRPEIDRGPLRDLLISSLKENTIVWNSQFKELIPSGDSWEIWFENGTHALADLVIAADGANSKLRKYITGIPAIYSGVTIIEGNIYNAAENAPILWQLTNGGKVFALKNQKTIILSAKGDGSLSFYTGTKEPENRVKTSGIDFQKKEEVEDWFKTRFADWNNDWHELFLSNDSYFIPRPQYHYPMNERWEARSNLTMIGDAAHRMPPYAGEGVNMAMQDALELYGELVCEDNKTLKDAIAAFEHSMCARAYEVTEITLQQTASMHGKNNLQYILSMFAGNDHR